MKSLIRMTGLLLLGTAACSTRSLSNFKTSQLFAAISATARGDGTTRVSVSYTENWDSQGANPFTFVQLTDEDALSATLGSTTQRLSETSLLGVVTYESIFPVDQGIFIVSLKRALDEGAPHSIVVVPLPFTVSSPQGSSVSRAQALDLQWGNDPAANPVQLNISGSCFEPLNTAQFVPPPSHFRVSAGALQKSVPVAGAPPIPDSCTATATVTRTATGTLDPAYGDGSITATQQRSLTFTSTP